MKKLGIIAALVVGANVALAASLGVPWYVDTADVATGIPQSNWLSNTNKGGVVTGLVTLKSNVATTLVCSITYYSADGVDLGPAAPDNTFEIAPLSALAFRPVANDPSVAAGGIAGGQEGAQGVLVPDRPRDVDTKKNGSIVISWAGDPTDVQGQVAYFGTSRHPDQFGVASPDLVTYSYAHLLPPSV